MQKAPQLPNHGALHYKKIDNMIVVQGSTENQEFRTTEQSNIGSRLQPGNDHLWLELQGEVQP